MVLPKDLRDRAGIKGGDKLAVIGWEKKGKWRAIPDETGHYWEDTLPLP